MFITANVKKVEADTNTYAGKVTLEHLHSGKRYVVQIASKNADNYNEFGESFIFTTKKDPNKIILIEEEKIPETEDFKEYEQEIEPAIEQEEASGLSNLFSSEGSGLEEDIVLPSEATDFSPDKAGIEEDKFLPVEDELITTSEGSGLEEDIVLPSEATD